MQIYEGKCCEGDIVSLNLLPGRVSERTLRLLLTHGIEIEIEQIQSDQVKLIVRAPGTMMIVEELMPFTLSEGNAKDAQP